MNFKNSIALSFMNKNKIGLLSVSIIIGALNTASHAEGKETTASGEGAHAEGYKTTASGNHSHAEG